MFRHQLLGDYELLKHVPWAYYQAQARAKVGDAVVTSWPTLDRYGTVRGVDDETCLVDYGNELQTYPRWWTSDGHTDGIKTIRLLIKMPQPSYDDEINFESI